MGDRPKTHKKMKLDTDTGSIRTDTNTKTEPPEHKIAPDRDTKKQEGHPQTHTLPRSQTEISGCTRCLSQIYFSLKYTETTFIVKLS